MGRPRRCAVGRTGHSYRRVPIAMPNPHKVGLLAELEARFGALAKLPQSNSLFTIGDDAARLYLRYSKVHSRGSPFFGLRKHDLSQLAGRNSFICLFVDDGSPPVFVPFADFEEVFQRAQVAGDGQYKVQLIAGHGTRELYIAKMGRFNIDGFVGFDALARHIDAQQLRSVLALTHCQVQTLLAGIGRIKGFDVFIPTADVHQLDWSLTPQFRVRPSIPSGYDAVSSILCEIDVIWVARGGNGIEGLFEVEHSTPVYSGLLRFNDVLLTDPRVSRFFIVSNETRRELFSRQVFRPTFRHTGLAELTSFLEYANVFDWHARLSQGASK